MKPQHHHTTHTTQNKRWHHFRLALLRDGRVAYIRQGDCLPSHTWPTASAAHAWLAARGATCQRRTGTDTDDISGSYTLSALTPKTPKHHHHQEQEEETSSSC